MRILVAHNRYQHAGGEDVDHEHAAGLLEEQGHDVFRYEVSNDRVDGYSAVALAKATVWNAPTRRGSRPPATSGSCSRSTGGFYWLLCRSRCSVAFGA